MLWKNNKGQNNFQNCTIKRKIATKLIIGIILLLIPIIIVIIDPIHQVVLYNTRVKNGSFLFNVFQTEVEGARIHLYIFNITNAERFLSGEDYKLKVEEVGPFSYVEIRRNGDVDLDEEAGEMWFTPHMKVKFLPEESIGVPQEVNVTVPNLALMSATSLITKYPSWIRNGFNMVAHQVGSKIISTIDAQSFLWGYNDPLIKLANKIIPGLIYFDKLGIIDRLYDNKTFYRMKVGITEKDKFSIKVLNKYLKGKKIEYQHPLESLHFNHTYEGASYPPGLTTDTPLNIYRTGVCRSLNLEFDHEVTMDYGPTGWYYKISNETFNRDCGEKDGICGMLDLSRCTYGIPISLSRTHFLNTDPKIYERIEGMHPDESKHESAFILEPKLGFELVTNLSLQLNLVLGDVSFNREVAQFSNMTVPISFINVIQPAVFEEFKLILKVVHVYGPNIMLCIEIILVIIATALLVKALKIYWSNKHSESEIDLVKTVNEKELPLLS